MAPFSYSWVFMGILGFLAGITIAYLDNREVFKYPLHFITGSAITLSILATFLISKKIKGRESPWRTIHFTIGLIIICLYFIQAFLGIGILF
jgi:uncharacterized membrane protein YwaF